MLTGILKPVGPTNYQFRKEGEQYLLLEVNPRISSSTSIRTAFGYNEAEMCITWYLHGNRPEQPEIHTGEARRYIADWVDVEWSRLYRIFMGIIRHCKLCFMRSTGWSVIKSFAWVMWLGIIAKWMSALPCYVKGEFPACWEITTTIWFPIPAALPKL